MTNKQALVCKCILKYRYLNRVLSKSGIRDYLELQDIIPTKYLVFSDINMDDNTQIELQGDLLAEYEERKRTFLNIRFAQAMSILSFIISVIALIKP